MPPIIMSAPIQKRSGVSTADSAGMSNPVGMPNTSTLAVRLQDWTERQPHLAGALGAGILDALLAQGYVLRRRKGRDVRIVRPLTRWLG